MFRHFYTFMLELHIFQNYKEEYPDLRGSSRTDQFIQKALEESDVGAKAAGSDRKPVIERTDKGKPFLAESNVHLSVSHSEDMLVVALSDEEIGIDLQHKRQVNIGRIASRFFSRDEVEYLAEQNDTNKNGEQVEAFFHLWTRKEAFAKLTGEGMGQLVKPVSVLMRNDVDFDEFTLEDGLYLCICTYKTKEESE